MKQYDAQTLLATSLVGDIFSHDIDKLKIEYKELAKFWHPDTNPNPLSGDVFSHINKLYKKALQLLEDGKWEKHNYIQFKTNTGKCIEINYLKMHIFELGKMYICNQHIIYMIDENKKKYFDNALLQIKNIKYPTSEIELEMKRFMPDVFRTYDTNDGKHCIVIKKTEDLFCMTDILDFYNGNIPDRHTAWIMTRLSNLTCFLEHIGIAHNGITIKNCFISPEHHSVMLYGGWWYAKEIGTPLNGVSKDVFDVMPLSVKSSKTSCITTDLESIKLIGRTLLGDKTGNFYHISNIPKEFKNWLSNGASTNAVDEYERWETALTKSYAQRKFVHMDVTKNQIYQN